MSTLGAILIIGAFLALAGLGCVSAVGWSDQRPRRLTDRECADIARIRGGLAAARDISGEHRGPGRHRYGIASGSCAQAARWNTTTGQFNEIRDLNWSDDEQTELRSVST